MRKIVKSSILIFSLIIILSIYINFLYEDKYFTYWDSYSNKVYSSQLDYGEIDSPSKDYGFYYNLNIYEKIIGGDYYISQKYGSLFIIIMISIIFFLIAREIYPEFKYLSGIFIIYYFMSPESLFRFGLTLRESFVMFIGFFMIFLIFKFKIKERKMLYLIIIFSTYIIFSHILTTIILVGSVYLFLSYTSIKENRKIYLIGVMILILVLSLPFLIIQSEGIFKQITLGNKIIERQGFTVEQSFIKQKDFIISFFILIPFFILMIYRTNKDKKILILCYSSICLFIYILPFFTSLGIKQDRLLLYIHFLIFLSFMGVNILSSKRIKILIITMILVLSIIEGVSYNTYRPIMEEDLAKIKELNIINDNYDACGFSACIATWYLDPPQVHNYPIIDTINMDNNLDISRIYLLNDDVIKYNREEYSNLRESIQERNISILYINTERKLRFK